jgi:hypothetical protein
MRETLQRSEDQRIRRFDGIAELVVHLRSFSNLSERPNK